MNACETPQEQWVDGFGNGVNRTVPEQEIDDAGVGTSQRALADNILRRDGAVSCQRIIRTFGDRIGMPRNKSGDVMCRIFPEGELITAIPCHARQGLIGLCPGRNVLFSQDQLIACSVGPTRKSVPKRP